MIKDMKAERLARDFIYLEAPRWHNGALWVPDVFDSILYRIDLHGKRSVIKDRLPPRPNSINFLSDGTPLIVLSVARQIAKLIDGELFPYVDLLRWAAGDVNDFAIDESDRLYVGNFGYDLFAGETARETSIHIVDPDGQIRVGGSGLEFPNGTVIINGGRTLVVAETWRGRLTAFDRAEDGSLSNPRLYADLPGREPDGVCADAEDGIWLCSFSTGEVLRVLEGAVITHRLQFRGSAVACDLGGDDGTTLFCTSYDGTIPDQQAMKRLGEVHVAKVDVPRC